MSEPKIVTNNVPRDIVYGYDLTPKEREDFDWMSAEDLDHASFFRYRGVVYALSEFMSTRGLPEDSLLAKWHGHHADSHFSAVVVRYTSDHEQVVVGLYLA